MYSWMNALTRSRRFDDTPTDSGLAIGRSLWATGRSRVASATMDNTMSAPAVRSFISASLRIGRNGNPTTRATRQNSADHPKRAYVFARSPRLRLRLLKRTRSKVLRLTLRCKVLGSCSKVLLTSLQRANGSTQGACGLLKVL